MKEKDHASWRIAGLIFRKLSAKFVLFSIAKSGKHPDNLTKEELEEWLPMYEKEVIENSVEAACRHYPVFYKASRKNQEIISGKLENSFCYFFAYLNAMSSIYNRLNEAIREMSIPQNYQFIFPLYGMLFRLADQIGVMLLNGYPDGAIRIWRSLYEFAQVTALSIKEVENADLQRKFISHFHRSQRKSTESFQKHYQDLNFPKPNEESVKELLGRIDKFNTRYGKDFLEEEYGWCNDLFTLKRRVTLRDIEDYVELQKYRPFYLYACGYTHPGFAAMLDFFEEGTQQVDLGRFNRQTDSLRHFIDPMQLTIAMLHEVNIRFLDLYSFPGEDDINIDLLRTIFEKLLHSFNALTAGES